MLLGVKSKPVTQLAMVTPFNQLYGH